MEQLGSDYLADLKVEFSVPRDMLQDFSVREVTMTESLLTPGLMTSIMVDAYVHLPRDYNKFQNAPVTITVTRPILDRYGYQPQLTFTNTIYRMQNRKLINNNNENMVFQALHDTQLEDARKLMSKSWRCDTPSSIVSEVLSSCLGSRSNNVEGSSPARPYIAENIHPFQVITQQADVALAGSTDPSFVHFMTYENNGTHNFRSLYQMTKQPSVGTFRFSEVGPTLEAGKDKGYMDPNAVMTHSFPCDFDLLSDLLNGINTNGSFIGALSLENIKNKLSSTFNFNPGFCSTAATFKTATSNINTEQVQDSCPLDVQNHLLKRQARMGLLEQDKIALRLTVPWNASLNAGKVITFERYSQDYPGTPLYGSGNYLIHSLTHIVKIGGYSTTVMDCVSTTVGQGIV
jgi:hypothetical protein